MGACQAIATTLGVYEALEKRLAWLRLGAKGMTGENGNKYSDYTNQVVCGDALMELAHSEFPTVDLVFTSPPYENARTYGGTFDKRGEVWLEWALDHFMAQLRVCRGLVAWVVQGSTRNYRWSPIPFLLGAELHNRGVALRRPGIYHRSGIPGSGGPDWLRCDHEYVLCATREGGRLPWSDNVAMGREPKFSPGGDPTNRQQNDVRVRISGMTAGAKNDMPHASHGGRSGELNLDGTITRKSGKIYKPPRRANPGDVIRCAGGHVGSKLAHEHPAPFPEQLAEFFVRSFCPPGGVVLDPFCGSGTTCAVAKRCKRNYIGIDIVPEYCDLATRRIEQVKVQS